MTPAPVAGILRRALLPGVVFLAVFGIHYLWAGIFAPQAEWLSVDGTGNGSWLRRYIEMQNHWLGWSYALTLAFAASALRSYFEQESCQARTVAIGGVTLSGSLGLAGCFLLGCCGSPMLAVYLNLFGVAFLPLARPLVAALSTLVVLATWTWMRRRRHRAVGPAPVSTRAGCPCD